MNLSAEERLWFAAGQNRFDELREIFLTCPKVNVNWKGESGNTALHKASELGNVAVVELLLLHPLINPNETNDVFHRTAFMLACALQQFEVIQVLLRDARVKVDAVDSHGCTALWMCAHDGHNQVVKWMMASGRNFGLDKKGLELQSEVKHPALYMAKQAVFLTARTEKEKEARFKEIVAMLEEKSREQAMVTAQRELAK